VGEIRFPNESAEYRTARDALTRAETELTRHIEEVAAQRRGLPPGGVLAEDYEFTEGPADRARDDPVTTVRLSQLFGAHDALLLYSFMYGPGMERPCQMCTSLLDGLDGAAPDVTERAAFAVVARAPIGQLREFARERRWVNLRLVSSAGTTYNADYHGETADGEQRTRLNVFVRNDAQIRHSYATEQIAQRPDWGDRHVDLLWPLWNLLDLTPRGRGEGWYPAYSDKAVLPAGGVADDVTTEVLAAEERRCAAIAAEDWAALGEIVADDFRYTHSNGRTEDKPSWIAGIRTRRRAVEHEHLAVRSFGDVALLSGNSVYRYAEPFRGDSHYGALLDVLQVWVRRPDGWRIVAQHGVKIADRN
jgi:predicted dithiol-disulfide oxidoreductase (DUF899 family)/ketosteroid isomerase-like protein